MDLAGLDSRLLFCVLDSLKSADTNFFFFVFVPYETAFFPLHFDNYYIMFLLNLTKSLFNNKKKSNGNLLAWINGELVYKISTIDKPISHQSMSGQAAPLHVQHHSIMEARIARALNLLQEDADLLAADQDDLLDLMDEFFNDDDPPGNTTKPH